MSTVDTGGLAPLRSGRVRRVLAVVALVAVAGGLGFWAGSVVLEPPADPVDESSAPEVYTVREGEVGRSMAVMAAAEWPMESLTSSMLSGVVTSVGAAGGDAANEGDVLFSVDLRPVVVLEGAVPMFRGLSEGVSGADVEQLQAALGRLGFFGGTPDGSFGASTQAAVRAWQESLGLDDDGVVRSGDVVYVDDLPARFGLDEGIGVGSRLSPGQQLLWRLGDAPDFELIVPTAQAEIAEAGRQVDIAHGDAVWEAEIASVTRSPDGQQLIGILVARSGGAVCGDRCRDDVPLTGRATYRAEVTVTPPTTGPIVPLAALITTADGRALAMRPTGDEVTVSLVAMADGLAVVDGLAAGDEVLVPFPASPTGEDTER